MGDSFHPGGVALTSRLARLMGVQASSNVLDAGSGRGASAVHLAHTVGCRVTGVTLEESGISSGYELAESKGVRDRVGFVRGDIQQMGLRDARFDFVLMECVLSTVVDKQAALRQVIGPLRSGGRLGLSDVTVGGPLPAELEGLLATVGCVGGALSLEDYGDLLRSEGLVVEDSADCGEVASSFLHKLGGGLLMAEVAAGLGKLPIGNGTLAEGRRLLESAQEQVERGSLSYGLLVARKPE